MRKIIHIDADAFYAAVEMRERPELKNLPIAVGGEPGQRGVIATCNYLARQFGVRSAMSSAKALQLCPDLLFIHPRFDLYKRVSRQMQAIFQDYTDAIEPLSLDEAYLDVTHSTCCQGSATRIAEEIRQRVRAETELTVSAGVAPNKFLAKVASEWRKPDGLFVIRPQDVADFVLTLPVGKINGVGKVTAEKMARLDIYTCQDLQQLSLAELVQHFGSYGPTLYGYARGEDTRSVETRHTRKSLSTEHTFVEDIGDRTILHTHLANIYDELLERQARISQSDYRVHKRFVKIKFADFTQTTLEESLHSVTEDWRDLNAYTRLLDQAWARQAKSVRLIGAGVRLRSRLDDTPTEQLRLFD
ncbi:MAG: DNA polymerase IV [Hahellaceae bacterium]|jgi:DNA polymerase-4|nr:DNA polymerase IV [Hahellaceae bacterium]